MADKIVDRKVFQAGEVIFREGDEGTRAFVVQNGDVEIFKTNEDDQRMVLGVVGPGGIFGEMALIDDSPRMASARARTMVTVIVVNREMFAAKLAKTDPFIRGLLNIFANNLRSLATRKMSGSGNRAG
jgi:CRP/FNR family transcriptional regulator, cyclic AMP receptor protein